jgi:hypothetical protein
MILTVGDSFTFGEELEYRCEQAWPYLLGKHLDQPVNNLGECGSSNDSIIRKTIEATIDTHYDLIIVAWTDFSRFECWSEYTRKPVTIMPNSQADLPWTDDFYRYSYNDNFSRLRWYNQILLVQQYFKSRDLNYLFVNVAGLIEQKKSEIWKLFDLTKYVGWPSRGLIEISGDAPRGPCGHPLALGHERIANEIKTYIRN